MYERFSDQARKMAQLAVQEAQHFNHEYLGTEHLLLGLLDRNCGVVADVLENLDVDLRILRWDVERAIQMGPENVKTSKLPMTLGLQKVFEYAMEEARDLNQNYFGPEHFLVGLLREEEGIAAQVLRNSEIDLATVREQLREQRRSGDADAEA